MPFLPPHHFEVSGFSLALARSPEVHSPSVDSLLLGSHLPSPFGESALDLGCGSGIISILLAKLGWPRVCASDLDKSAVMLTRHNRALNGVSSGGLVVSDMFAAFSPNSFDLIVCNPPCRPSRNPDSLPIWNRSGEDGTAFISRFYRDAHPVLQADGRIVSTHSSLVALERFIGYLSSLCYSVRQITELHVPFREGYYQEYGHIMHLAHARLADVPFISGVPVEKVYVLESTRI